MGQADSESSPSSNSNTNVPYPHTHAHPFPVFFSPFYCNFPRPTRGSINFGRGKPHGVFTYIEPEIKKTSVSVAYMHSPRRCAAPVIHSYLCSLSFLLPIMSIQRTCPCPTRHHARSYSSALLFFPSGLSFPIMPPARPAPPPRS